MYPSLLIPLTPPPKLKLRLWRSGAHGQSFSLVTGLEMLQWTDAEVLLLTLQQLGVDEQLQGQQQHHHHHAGHQDAVEPCRQQAHLPQRRPAAAARLQPVGPVHRVRGQTEVQRSAQG